MIAEFNLIKPTEENGYRCFSDELENDDCVFFHITEKENFDSIVQDGFKSKFEQTGNENDLKSVSYAKSSTYCLIHKVNKNNSVEYVIFAVRFTKENLKQVKNNRSDINVYINIQPEILGYVAIPKDFKYD